MVRAMRRVRRVRRFVARVLVLAVLVLGSLAGLDQWVTHAEEPAPAEAPAEAPPPEHSRPAAPRKRSAFPGPFRSPEACQKSWATRSQSVSEARARRGPRIGTWNVRWFPLGSDDGKNLAEHTDVAWLACAIAHLDVDVLAVQEFLDNVEARNAQRELIEKLDALTGGRHRIELDECAGGRRQHVGLLWDETRVTLDDVRSIAALNPKGSMCAASLRPGLGAHARFADGSDLHVISVHLDSGIEARDFEHRASSVRALGSLVPALRARDGDVLVLGDYNAMGCSQCAPAVTANDELAQLDGTLGALALHRLEHALGNRCTHYYRGHAGLLDFAVATTPLKQRVEHVRASGVCEALACERPKRGESPLAWDRLSDHCPLVVQLQPTSKRSR
jgi:endonuclease/exonuclease/phosphatase family metal-dependent hydrolase